MDKIIPIIDGADVKGKVVLIREDHNIVRNNKIDDDYRLIRSKPTVDWVIKNGGFPVLMTHIGRPRDDETGNIKINQDESVVPLKNYMEDDWNYSVKIPDVDLSKATEKGLPGLDNSVDDAIKELKAGKVQIVYLPNTRWFTGEEAKGGEAKERLTNDLAHIVGDDGIFVNNAFGSHQPHVSTYWITKKLPSFAGLLMMEEIEKLQYLLNLPEDKHPFLAIVAGAKINTKIGALESLREMADNLLVGGLPASALICAKYGVKINGIKEKDIKIARGLLEKDKSENKLLIPDLVITSDVKYSKENPREEVTYQEVDLTKVEKEQNLGYVYDVSPKYFKKPEVIETVQSAKTTFTNAVVGFDKAGFKEGTIALYKLLAQSEAQHNFGGGDTLKALLKYTPNFYKRLIEDSDKYTLFTGGGTILKGFKSMGVYKMEVIKALVDNGGKKPI